MFQVNGTNIVLSRGDTGGIKFTAEGYTFGPDDRALFSVRNAGGTIVKQEQFELVDNAFYVTFFNADTDALTPGNFTWDVRYVINPYYDSDGRIVDGDQVITPNTPQQLQLLTVVGEI